MESVEFIGCNFTRKSLKSKEIFDCVNELVKYFQDFENKCLTLRKNCYDSAIRILIII